MKINSVTTQELGMNNRILSTSKKVFKVKPEVPDVYTPFFQTPVFKAIEDHQKFFSEFTREYVVTVSTSKGKFIKTFGRFR